MAGIVYATSTSALRHEGQIIQVRAGEAWDADDPLIARYPDIFTDTPRGVRVSTTAEGWKSYEADEPPVETARRGPGEKRTTTRRPRSG